MLIVPFTADYAQNFVVLLGGDKFVVDARWNERGQHWTFDLTRQADGKQLLVGVPLLSGQDVLAPYGLRIGGMVPVDLSNTASDAGPEDLGSRVVVMWLSSTELLFLQKMKFPGIVGPGPFPPVAGQPLPPTIGGSGGGGTGSVIIPTGGGGGGGGGGPPIVITGGQSYTMQGQIDDSDGRELLVFEIVMNAGIDLATNISLAAGFLAASAGGTMHVRAYIGGTFDVIGSYYSSTPSGVLVATVPITGSTLGPAWMTGTPTPNPGGLIPVKFTLQSSASTVNATLAAINGVVG